MKFEWKHFLILFIGSFSDKQITRLYFFDFKREKARYTEWKQYQAYSGNHRKYDGYGERTLYNAYRV